MFAQVRFLGINIVCGCLGFFLGNGLGGLVFGPRGSSFSNGRFIPAVGAE